MESFHFDHVRLRPQEQIGLHTQPSWELSWVMRGKGRRTLGDLTEPFEAGEVVLVPPDVPHEWHFDDSDGMIENITLIFSTDFLLLVGGKFPEMAGVTDALVKITRPITFTRRTLLQLREALEGMCHIDASGKLVSVLSMLRTIAMSRECRAVGHPVRDLSRDQDWLKEVEIYVTCNHRRHITLDMIAAHLCMNRSAFCSRFRRTTGKTFVTYLNDYRLNIALRLLAKGGMKVAQVCYHSGFNDVPHFNRLFKSRFGMTPTQFQQQSSAEL